MKRFSFVHASGNTFMPTVDEKADVGHLLALRPHPLWITLTEIGQTSTVAAIREVVNQRDAPYDVINPDSGDIAFLVNHEAHVANSAGPLSVPGKPGPARLGGHGPRHNSYVELHWEDEIIYANGVHFVTFHTNHATDSGNRSAQQVKQALDVARQMKHQASGSSIAVGSGDLNGSLPQRKDLQRVFHAYNMTTTSHETGVTTPTHGNARIDYAWTMDHDKRLHVVHMKVLRSSQFNSDHDPIVNNCEIR
jgi:hypothetical protein